MKMALLTLILANRLKGGDHSNLCGVQNVEKYFENNEYCK